MFLWMTPNLRTYSDPNLNIHFKGCFVLNHCIQRYSIVTFVEKCYDFKELQITNQKLENGTFFVFCQFGTRVIVLT